MVLGFSWLQRHNLGYGFHHGLESILPSTLSEVGTACPWISPYWLGLSLGSLLCSHRDQDLREVFNSACATSLPLHQPYDCAIDLLPGTAPPWRLLYTLSGPENTAMKGYIENSLAAGIMHPCIDYWGLNDITVKKHFPLPII